ncbi:MAG: Protein translocase subunit SecF, partial [uncultured Ramlibacter sp.]
GVFQDPARHPVHAECAGVQHHLVRHLRRRGVLPGHAGPAPVSGVHRRHGDAGELRAGCRRGGRAPHRRRPGLRRSPGAELRHRARRHDPPAGAKGRELGAAERPGARGPQGGGSVRDPAPHRIRGATGGRGAGHRRPQGAGHGGGRDHDLPGVPLRVEVRGGGHHRQPARRDHHPGLLRLFPVGVLAGGAGRGAGGAGVFGQRVGGDLRPHPREL